MPTDTIFSGDAAAAEIFFREMGIKEAYAGDVPVYQRTGGYFYLILDTKESE